MNINAVSPLRFPSPISSNKGLKRTDLRIAHSEWASSSLPCIIITKASCVLNYTQSQTISSGICRVIKQQCQQHHICLKEVFAFKDLNTVSKPNVKERGSKFPTLLVHATFIVNVTRVFSTLQPSIHRFVLCSLTRT